MAGEEKRQASDSTDVVANCSYLPTHTTTSHHSHGLENGRPYTTVYSSHGGNHGVDSNLNSMVKEGPNQGRHLGNQPVYAPKYGDGIVKLPERDHSQHRPDLQQIRVKDSHLEVKSNSNSSNNSSNSDYPPGNIKTTAIPRPKNANNGQYNDELTNSSINGKNSKNGKSAMPPPQQRIVKPKGKTQKPVTSPQEQRIPKTPNSPTKTRAPPTSPQVSYQKQRYPAPSQTNSGHNYGSQYGNQQGYVVRSSPQSNAMYGVSQRGQPQIRAQPPASGSPQVIIQPQGSGSSTSQQHFIIQTPNEQYSHRAGGPPGQRTYTQSSSGTPVSVAGQQQQVVIQFHHQAPNMDNSNMGQRLVIHPQQLVEHRRIVTSSGGYPPNSQPPSSSQQGVVHAQVNVDVPDRPSGSSMPTPRPTKAMPPQPKIHQKPDEVLHEVSTHPDFTPLPDSFHIILDQIHTSNVPPKELYKKMKRQFKFLVFENESYQEELRSSQRKLLKLSRDKNFLLDRLLAHEVVESDDQAMIGEESDAESDVTIDLKPKPKKKKPAKKRPLPLNQTAPTVKKAATENGNEFHEGKQEDGSNPAFAIKQNNDSKVGMTDFSGIKLETSLAEPSSHARPSHPPLSSNSLKSTDPQIRL